MRGEMMSAQGRAIPPIPKETDLQARTVLGGGNFYLNIGDHLEGILEDVQPGFLSETGRDLAGGGVTLSLVTFFQYVEDLTDIQAIDAIRTRIEWKYAVHLPINTLAFHPSTLCSYRRLVLKNLRCQNEFQKIINGLVAFNPPLNGKFKDFSVLEVISEICSLNQRNWALTAVCESLEVLAVKYPQWLRQIALPHWYGRYNHLSAANSSTVPFHDHELSMDEIGADIHYLLLEVDQSRYQEINKLQVVKSLRGIWKWQFNKSSYPISYQLADMEWKDCGSCIIDTR
jgi:transposase